jgi:hypothetical protein
MSRYTLAVLCLGLLGLPVLAQDAPKRIEVFGGYQFLHAGNFDGAGDGSANTNGWDGSATFNFAKHLGVTADFSGNYKQNFVNNGNTYPAAFRIYTYTFGPQASFNVSQSLRIFAHTLFGGAHVRPTACVIFSGSPDECGSGNVSGFAIMIGGGVDAKVNTRLDLRMFQVDWVRLPSQFGAQSGDLRVSAGVVFRF